MYESCSISAYLGCSVHELNGLSWYGHSNVAHLRSLRGNGITIAVTNTDQKGSEKALKQAGFACVAEYKNYNGGHTGNVCKLWAAVGRKGKFTKSFRKKKIVKKKTTKTKRKTLTPKKKGKSNG